MDHPSPMARRVAAAWLRQAGIFQAPPKVVEDIYQQGMVYLCDRLLDRIDMRYDEIDRKIEEARADDDEWTVEFQENRRLNTRLVEREAKKWSRGRRADSIRVLELTPDFTGWRYVREIKQRTGKTPEEILAGNPYISSTYTIKMQEHPHAKLGGSWSEARYTMTLQTGFTPHDLSTFRSKAAEFRKLIEHEAGHLGQTYLKMLLSVHTEVGTPSRSLAEPGYSPEGNPLGPSGYAVPGEMQEHGLREVEFYTRLRDEITDFKTLARRIPKSGWPRALRVWVGDHLKDRIRFRPDQGMPVTVRTSGFFETLKQHNKPKWRKAVAEFVKAVDLPTPTRIASTWLMARRVASAWLRDRQAGVLEAPPAMHEAITKWVLATVAATEIEKLQAEADLEKARHREAQAEYKKLRDAIREWQASPTSWKVYKSFFETAVRVVWLHPNSRWSIREFQKMTPEKRDALERKQQAFIREMEEKLDIKEEQHRDYLKRLEDDARRLKPYLMSGAKAVDEGGEVTKDFPVDLTGWRYEDAVDSEMRSYIEELEAQLDEVPDNFRESFETYLDDVRGRWKAITVRMSRENIRNARAYWKEASKEVWVRVPRDASPWSLDELSGSVRHELQHMAQSLMGQALAKVSENVSSFELMRQRRQPRPGMPSRHIMTPEYLQYEEEAKAIKQRLKSQGINPRTIDIHALDDVEFYTRLADSIDRFNRMKSRANPGKHLNTMVKLWTNAMPYPTMHGWGKKRFRHTGDWHDAMRELGGYDIVKHYEPSSFFKTLKKLAPAKWRKAVGEFTKAVA